jgi:hypothetical protein
MNLMRPSNLLIWYTIFYVSMQIVRPSRVLTEVLSSRHTQTVFLENMIAQQLLRPYKHRGHMCASCRS